MNANLGTGLTYQWKLNGAAIAGANTNTFKTGIAGNYSVIVTSIYGCPKESAPASMSAARVISPAVPAVQLNQATRLMISLSVGDYEGYAIPRMLLHNHYQCQPR